jgi:methyl-accepting chemotaxis protein
MKTHIRRGKWLSRLSVGQQLWGAFLSILLLMGGLGASALFGLGMVEGNAVSMHDKWLKGVGDLSDARALLVESRAYEIKHSRTDDASYHAEYEDKMKEVGDKLAQIDGNYKARVDAGEETELLKKFDGAMSAYRGAQERVIKLGRDKQQQDAADIADGASSMAYDELTSALEGLIQFNYAGGNAATEMVRGVSRLAHQAVWSLLALAAVLATGLAWAITRNLLRQLGGEPSKAVAVARAVAEGDLTTPIPLRAKDTDSLLAWLQIMQQGLSKAVNEVRGNSDHVALASSEIASGNQDLSGRTEQQASELQQTAATMEQLGTTVRHNADNARQASQLAQGASSVAIKGGQVVGQVVETMKGINESSQRIVDIIGVIDGIAFQTNILALNAAVEAARAGEQGRGFAVVAAEVRSLAQRSAQAAKEIKVLIGASVDRVQHGSTLVDEAGQTMGEVVAAIRRVSDIVGEISAASSEQSSGVVQVGQAINRMDQGTQQNAALVEQSAAAADSLRQLSMDLVKAVSVFKTTA